MRVFTANIEATRQRRANRKYYAAVEIRLPPSPGDPQPPVIRVAEADLMLPSLLTYEEFTYQSFMGVLGRNPTAVEQADWVAQLAAAFAISTAAVVTEAVALIRGLLTGAEFLALDTTDSEFVSRLYSGYLGRFPEIGGKAFWLADLQANGRGHVIDSFEASVEFGGRAGEINALIHYLPSIRSISAIALNDGNAADNVDLSLDNLDDRFSAYLGESSRLLYPAPTLVMRAYPVGLAGDDYEADVKITGFATFSNIVKRTADITVVSDVNRQGLSVGDVDTQRCKLIYKGRGCDTNDPTPTCSRIWDDAANGCASKEPAPILIGAVNNQPSFGGGPDKAVEASGGVTVTPNPNDPTPVNPWPNPGYTDPEDPRTRSGRDLPMREYNIA